MTEPKPPEHQLPPPTGPAVTPPTAPAPGRRGPLVAAVLVAALALVVAGVVLIAGGRDEENLTTASTEPAPRASAAPSPSAAPSASATAEATETAAAPAKPTGDLRALVADRVGDYRLAGIDRGNVLIDDEGASEAFTMSYKGRGLPEISHQVGFLDSSDAADALRRERIAERREFGAKVVSEEPYAVGEQRVGTYTVTKEDGLYLALWTNGNLFATALTDDENAVRGFVAAAPY